MEQTRRYVPENWLEPFRLADLFAAPAPFEVDVGCGKGRFLLARAAAHPEINYLGVDRMLRRIRKVDRKAVRAGLDNVRLLRMDACYAVTWLIPSNCVSAYYVFFPDPWPKTKHHHHRLFDRRFMDALVRTLIPGGMVNFATDHLPYYDEVRGLLEADGRFEPAEAFVPCEEEKTDFELMFIGQKPIGRCSFRAAARGGAEASL